MRAEVSVSESENDVWRRLSIVFFLVLNAVNLSLALFTQVSQLVIFVLFLVSFVPYILAVKLK